MSHELKVLCENLLLGDMIGEGEPIYGGLLHKMFKVRTTLGIYAVKALNPQIMLRDTAMCDYVNSEMIVSVAAKYIRAAAAKIFNSTAVQECGGRYYLIYDFMEGVSLRPGEIAVEHSASMGALLAEIHKIDFSGLGLVDVYSSDERLTDWDMYLRMGRERGEAWAGLLEENIESLRDWNKRGNSAAKALSAGKKISHCDADPKNVLWDADGPVLIDWESAGYIHPMQDLMDTALYWSEISGADIDMDRFFAFTGAYKKTSGSDTLDADWDSVLDRGFSGKLGWLEYSLKRSLMLECADEDEQRLGTEQVFGTISGLRQYAELIPWLRKKIAVV